jgi:hypothetical protein
MKLSKMAKAVVRLMLAGFLVMNLSGCDQLRSRMADLIAPQSPGDALKSIEAMTAAGQLKEALAKAESFMAKPGDLRPRFELAGARVAAMQGDVDAALRYLARALAELNLTPDQLMADVAFSEMRTDIRFIQTITRQASPNTAAAKPPSAGTQVKASEDTEIKINNQGTEVRAGDIVIKLPN